MGYFDSDTLEMLDIYLLETSQLMEKLDVILMDGEKSETFSEEDINQIFRIMHTIKSSSAMMGLTELSEIAHSLEDVFAMLRDHAVLSEGRQKGLLNLLFGASDFIQRELELMVHEEYKPSDPEGMKQEIAQALTRLKAKLDSREPVPGQDKTPENHETDACWIKVFFESDCCMEHLRAYMLMRQIKEVIPDAVSIPKSPERDEGAEDYIREKGFLIQVPPDLTSQALEIIGRGLFVLRCELAGGGGAEMSGKPEGSGEAEAPGRPDGVAGAEMSGTPEGSIRPEMSGRAWADSGKSEPGMGKSLSGLSEAAQETGNSGAGMREEPLEKETPMTGPAKPSPGTEAEKPPAGQEKTVRNPLKDNGEPASRVDMDYVNVRLDRLDELQNLTGELIILMSAFRNELKLPRYAELEERYGYSAGQILNDLEKTVMNMRMVPVAQIIPKLKRIVRDLGRKQGKMIEFVASGQEVEADKYIVEQLYEASMHIIRNAADHGIEPAEMRRRAGKEEYGTISFEVESSGGDMIVRISDDGRGIDEEKLRKKAREKNLFTKPEKEYSLEEIYELCTLPGLSTRKKADEYSGRGVGMDIVRKITEDNGGHLRIESKRGKGTSIIMDLPLAHTIVEAVRFEVDGCMFSVLSHQVCRFTECRPEETPVHEEHGRRVLLYENQIFPVIDIADFYGLNKTPGANRILIHVKGIEKQACLLVDRVYGEEKLVQKPLPSLFGNKFQRQTAMNGCSVLGDGNICMAVDVETLISLASYEAGKGVTPNGK
ncbi:hypothetical protein GPL15_15110 [Clostridium sp. MCC353]|uniref:chemotaxis protein CheA n=1 Tax=Clostridium sp. MCC353 TaxID=2592646 RepID=UPI001C02F67D|nr:chemotaxis protein CheA [Clostridium sp. MCC353]MBT9777831.1 hypothetical protein [Clostridium sp. MCC353]